MPRKPRSFSNSGFYHVTVRGEGRRTMFEDDSDRRAFLDLLDLQVDKHGLVVHAWCLMGNHVHLLLEDPRGRISEAMHGLATSYAQRFNKRTGHVGHVFQDRFFSEPIENEAYLLEVVRYIHNNPENGGIGSREEYPWSSYREYVGEARHCDVEFVLGLLGGVDRFVEFSAGRGSPYRHMRRMRISDEESRERAAEVLGGVEPGLLAALPKPERNLRLRDLRSSGLSVRQIERLTGIGRWTITNATT